MQFAPFGETQSERETDLLTGIKLGLIVVFGSDCFFSLPPFARTLLVSPLVVPKVFFVCKKREGRGGLEGEEGR